MDRACLATRSALWLSSLGMNLKRVDRNSISLRRTAISTCLPLEFTKLMRIWESEQMMRPLIPQRRAEVMASLNAKVSAVRGDATKVAIAEWEEDEPASSMIQASPAHFVDGFHAASVYMQVLDGTRLGSWLMRGLIWWWVGFRFWAEVHSRASRIAFRIVSSGEKWRFWKIN